MTMVVAGCGTPTLLQAVDMKQQQEQRDRRYKPAAAANAFSASADAAALHQTVSTAACPPACQHPSPPLPAAYTLPTAAAAWTATAPPAVAPDATAPAAASAAAAPAAASDVAAPVAAFPRDVFGVSSSPTAAAAPTCRCSVADSASATASCGGLPSAPVAAGGIITTAAALCRSKRCLQQVSQCCCCSYHSFSKGDNASVATAGGCGLQLSSSRAAEGSSCSVGTAACNTPIHDSRRSSCHSSACSGGCSSATYSSSCDNDSKCTRRRRGTDSSDDSSSSCGSSSSHSDSCCCGKSASAQNRTSKSESSSSCGQCAQKSLTDPVRKSCRDALQKKEPQTQAMPADCGCDGGVTAAAASEGACRGFVVAAPAAGRRKGGGAAAPAADGGGVCSCWKAPAVGATEAAGSGGVIADKEREAAAVEASAALAAAAAGCSTGGAGASAAAAAAGCSTAGAGASVAAAAAPGTSTAGATSRRRSEKALLPAGEEHDCGCSSCCKGPTSCSAIAGEKYEVRVEAHDMKFSCAHFMAYKGFREKLHGHNYTVAARVGGVVCDDGYVMDFRHLRTTVRDICKTLNEHVLVPTRSDVLRIRREQQSLHICCEDGAEFMFPLSDCQCLPIVHSSAEELCCYLWGRTVEAVSLRLLQERGVKWLEVSVSEAPTQTATYRRHI